MTISFVTMTWNRSGQRAINLLMSLSTYQASAPREVIVVDTSDNIADISSVIQAFRASRIEIGSELRLIRQRRHNLYKAWALNVGIRAATGDYIATTDIDMMFGPRFVEALAAHLQNGAQFVMAEVRGLPEGIAGMTLDHDWLVEQSVPWPADGRGALQCAHRDWWHKVHGYDERFKEGLGGVEDDVLYRAQKDGLRIDTIRFVEGQALHQWHPQSPLKGLTLHLKDPDGPVVRNEGGWGE